MMDPLDLITERIQAAASLAMNEGYSHSVVVAAMLRAVQAILAANGVDFSIEILDDGFGRAADEQRTSAGGDTHDHPKLALLRDLHARAADLRCKFEDALSRDLGLEEHLDEPLIAVTDIADRLDGSISELSYDSPEYAHEDDE